MNDTPKTNDHVGEANKMITPDTIITAERIGDLIRCRFCDWPASGYPGVYKCDSVTQNGIQMEHMRGMRCIQNERDTLRVRVKELENQINSANAKIQRLVEAGNSLRNALNGFWNGTTRTTDTQANGALVEWNKAKEGL